MTTSPEGGISGHSWPFSLSIADHPPSHRYRPERRRIQATGSGQLGKNPRFYAEIGYAVDRNGGREDESLPPAHEPDQEARMLSNSTEQPARHHPGTVHIYARVS